MGCKPNIVVILCDDLGYSDIGCYGGEIDTPNIDSLARDGVRFTDFYSTPRCAPSRASLLTGLHPHQAGIGILTYNDGPLGYPGALKDDCTTIAQQLRQEGYGTYISGKWHLTNDTKNPNPNWPLNRGFDRHFGTLAGSCSYYNPHTLMVDNKNVESKNLDSDFYYTDAITDHAVSFLSEHVEQKPDDPLFLYLAYTAPHWPLQAPESVIQKYKGRFDAGWDKLREQRFQRLKKLGIADSNWALSPRDPEIPSWEEVEDKEWYLRCMEVYAAQVEVMDQGVGRVLQILEDLKIRDNTFIVFLSDNGGCNEYIKAHPEPGAPIIPKPFTRTEEKIIVGNHHDVMPGPENTFQTYTHWANLSNTPFRLYKTWGHEGGISTPCIMQWGDNIRRKGSIIRHPGQLTDLAATILDIAGLDSDQANSSRTLPLEGTSLTPLLQDKEIEDHVLCWEHQGNAAIRYNQWKAVMSYPDAWELYNIENDRSESDNLAEKHQDILYQLVMLYTQWADRCNVIPRERILRIPGRTTIHNEYCGWMI